MNIEIGHYALILALAAAGVQTILSLIGAYRYELTAIQLGIRACKLQFYLVTLSFVVLVIGFLNNDFSVSYIATNSNAYLPWYYRLSATWSSHEGSLLLWAWILATWQYFLAVKSTDYPPAFRGKIFMVLGVISIGFISFIVLTSNPFLRLLPEFPLIGQDLNPMLQDIGLVMHPPILYMGYVGFSISFAFIIAALLEGKFDTLWARWARPWVTASWAFLTLGIALGSWWAYYELGWGGWWFWDPVENASLMPWLAGSALIHSLAASEKRNVFKGWTAFLAITTFSLSLMGTFLVRSGVLTSVHAFANDPTRGIYILGLITLISGSAFVILVLRMHCLRSTSEFALLSRETGLLINNLIFGVACAIVFIGTLSPLVFDVFKWGKISVGPPYFNLLMTPVLVIILLFLCFAPYMHWKRDELKRLMIPLAVSVLLSMTISALLLTRYHFDLLAWGLLVLAVTAMLMSFYDTYHKTKSSRKKRPAKSVLAMNIAHLGFYICAIGMVMTSVYSVEKDVLLTGNEKFSLADISVQKLAESSEDTPVYQADRIDFLLRDKNNQVLGVLSPEKRLYKISQTYMTESDLSPSLLEDIYIALGKKMEENWSVRLQVKPFIRWIWLGALIMAAASLFVIFDKRYRVMQKGANHV